MIGKELPDADNVVRHVGGSKLDENGKVTRSAFRLDEGETALSVSWLEYFQVGTKEEQLVKVRQCIERKLGRNSRFAELNVGATKECVNSQASKHHCTIGFNHDPTDVNLSHAIIIGLPRRESPSSRIVAKLIADPVIALHPAVVD